MRFIIHLCVYMCTGNDVTTCTWTYIPNYLLSKHERKTKTNLFWHVKFICFHLISATSIDKTAQLLKDNRQDLHFDNENKIFAIKRFQLKLVKSFPILGSITGDPLHSRALAHSRAPLFTQPCPHCSHSRASGEQWARLCVFTLQGCVQAARLCRGSPVSMVSH